MKKTNLERRKDAQRQARHWKHCADRQRAQIASLQEEIAGYKQLIEASNALVTGVLVAAGCDADHPVDVGKEMISAAVRGEIDTQADLTEGGYRLHCVGTPGER